MPVWVAHQQVARRENDLALLVRVDAVTRAGEAITASRPNFDDDDCAAIPAYEIEFA